jgi:hypothetical protein
MLGNGAKRRNKLLYGAGALLALTLASGAYVALERSHSGVIGRPAASGSEAELVHTLTALEGALKGNMSVDQMGQFAGDVEAEIKAHPLPEEDDLQFGGELIVRYLRSLAATQNYRDLKLRTNGYDPLDPGSAHPNKEAIELQAKYSAWLPQRVKELREALSKTQKRASR